MNIYRLTNGKLTIETRAKNERFARDLVYAFVLDYEKERAKDWLDETKTHVEKAVCFSCSKYNE